ncbi:hypothetical protein ACLBKU_09080 [Erythrobacter sp. NE805]|uniref:hypothetical protein n=1 Tax=Erythrobacter sp. NE805 TaxID=3389875 RepID=UPI00396AF21C
MARSEPVPDSEREEGMSARRFVGPGLVCGLGFAIALHPDERFSTFDPMMDFVTHRLEGSGRAAVIYEGNYPQPADAYLDTGRTFPDVVALHLDGYDKTLAERILVKGDLPSECEASAQP